MTVICPDDGRLRAWLDREAGADGDGLAGHLAGCRACQTTLAGLRRDAEHAAQALGALAGATPSPADAALALTRLRRQLEASAPVLAGRANGLTARPAAIPGSSLHEVLPPAALAAAAGPTAGPAPSTRAADVAASTTPQSRSAPMSLLTLWRRGRLAFGGLAAALALTLLLLTPEGQAAASGFLAQFRSQRLQIVTFNPEQARQTGILRLERLGTVRTTSQGQRPVELANIQEAASRAGLPVLQPDPATLPNGVAKTPRVRFNPPAETRLTFDRQKVRQYFDALNRPDLALPDRLHGSTLVVALPPVVMLEYAAGDGKPALMVGQAREVQVGVEGGASLDEVRDFLLSLPDLPSDLARQLRAIQDWRNTLPIPVPVDKIAWQGTTIAGAPAYILNDNTGLGSAVIWQRDGRIIGVAGPMRANDLRRVAESLH